MSNFTDKVMIVTGSTQGVGGGIARHLAELGVGGLVICGRNQQKGSAVASDLEARGTPCTYVPADLSKESDCRAVVAGSDQRFGRIDGLVNAAGLTNRGTLDDTTVECGICFSP